MCTCASVKPGSRYTVAGLFVGDFVKLVYPAAANDQPRVVDALSEHIDDVAGKFEIRIHEYRRLSILSPPRD